jgi:hypothetical protein
VLEPVKDAGDVPQSVRFRPAPELTPEAVAVIAEQVRVRVLRWFARSGLIEPEDIREMLAWENSGFSLDAAVRVGAHDRAGLERLFRYCARPPFALERLERIDEQQVIYRPPRTQRDGTTALSLTPLELIDHLAVLIPPPRRHRHRYHGVLAPNAPLRAAAVAFGRDAADDLSACAEANPLSAAPLRNMRSPARYLWAMLLARLFESLPLTCPNCGADMRIIAFITDVAPVARILTHIGEPSRPPPIAPARPGAALSCFAWVPAQTILVWAFAASAQLTHPPGTMIPSRRRTGTSSPNRAQASSLTSASPGNRHLLPQRVDLTPARCACNLLSNPAEARSDTSEMSAPLSVAP